MFGLVRESSVLLTDRGTAKKRKVLEILESGGNKENYDKCNKRRFGYYKDCD